MSAKVFTINELLSNLNKVQFSELKRQQSGFVSWVNFNEKGSLKRIYVKTPKMFAPFGATNYNPNNVAAMNNKFAVALSFKGEDTNKEIADLKTLLGGLDKLVIDHTCSHKDWSKQINKKKCSRDVIESSYTRVLKEVEEDAKFPALFNLKAQINWRDGVPCVGTKVYNTQKESLPIDFDNFGQVLPKLTDMKCIFQVASVWFINKKFGLTVKLVQAKVFPNMMGQLPDFALDDEEDDEVAQVVSKTSKMAISAPVVVEEEEEESDDEEEEESDDE